MRETESVSRSPKVVPLNAPDLKAGRNTALTLPPILHSVRQTARRNLSALLTTLFNNADDVLFEMADRSRNDGDQHMYFDSMREIRVQRKRIATEFGQRLYAGFDALYESVETDGEETTDFETGPRALPVLSRVSLCPA